MELIHYSTAHNMIKTIKHHVLIIICAGAASTAFSQINFSYQHVDSLKTALANAHDDSTRVLTMAHLSEGFRWSNPDSAMQYGERSLGLARHIGFRRGEASALISMSVVNRELGNLPEALDYAMKGLEIAQDKGFLQEEVSALIRVCLLYTSPSPRDS